jgi:hypothetical protein
MHFQLLLYISAYSKSLKSDDVPFDIVYIKLIDTYYCFYTRTCCLLYIHTNVSLFWRKLYSRACHEPEIINLEPSRARAKDSGHEPSSSRAKGFLHEPSRARAKCARAEPSSSPDLRLVQVSNMHPWYIRYPEIYKFFVIPTTKRV